MSIQRQVLQILTSLLDFLRNRSWQLFYTSCTL